MVSYETFTLPVVVKSLPVIVTKSKTLISLSVKIDP